MVPISRRAAITWAGARRRDVHARKYRRLKGGVVNTKQMRSRVKLRESVRMPVSPFQGLPLFGDAIPRALPWALLLSPFRQSQRGRRTATPARRQYYSPGQRPGNTVLNNPSPERAAQPIPHIPFIIRHLILLQKLAAFLLKLIRRGCSSWLSMPLTDYPPADQ